MSTSFDLYQTVTDQIVAMLDAGVAPWRSPILGRSTAGQPRNLDSGKAYRGVNTFLLAFSAFARGYESSYWVTFNQARAQGGSVKKGEKSTMVVFWKSYDTSDRKTGDPVTVPVLRYYNVFNLAQCDGLAAPDAVPWVPTAFESIDAAEAIARGYEGRPPVTHGGQMAYYRPADDTVQMPDPTRFTLGEDYYSTLFHEYAHSTGHRSRLDRGFVTCPRPYGTPDYGKEELLAEMAAAFLSARAGMTPDLHEHHAAYCQGWVKVLKGDKRLVVAAAGAAQRAADWVLGERGDPADAASVTPPVPATPILAAAA